ncbi:MAG: DUF3795 domain-containing protein [Candidatus Sumerlaeota bacterium]
MNCLELPAPCGVLCVSCRYNGTVCEGCGDGGGAVDCIFRDCSEKQGLRGCWECRAFPCDYLVERDDAWRGVNIGLLRTIREVGPQKFVETIMLRIGPGYEYDDLRFLSSREVRDWLVDGVQPFGIPRG